MRKNTAFGNALANAWILALLLTWTANAQDNAQAQAGFSHPAAVQGEAWAQAMPSQLLSFKLQERQAGPSLLDEGSSPLARSGDNGTMTLNTCLLLDGSGDAPKKEETKESAPSEPEKERSGGIRLGMLIPTSAKVEKLSIMPAAGLFWFTNPIDEKKKWRVELGLDAAFRNESGVDDKLFLFRAGIGYVATENAIIVGGLGYALEKFDFAGYHDSYSAALFNIGALYRISKIVDVRLDYCFFAGSDNTTGAVYLTAGLWF